MKTEQAIDATVLAVSNKATVLGGGTSILGFVASVNWLGLLGFLIALTGLLVSWYYSSKKNAREEDEKKYARMQDELREKRERIEHELKVQEYHARIEAAKRGDIDAKAS